MPQSRRDFIKTVILSTGAVFASWNDVLAFTGKRANLSIQPASLHFQQAHELLRDLKRLPPSFPVPSRTLDTVIVGGGAAGLAAAWKLKKAGKDVLVLENEPQVGGVMHLPVKTWQGLAYPLGSTYFYRYNGVYKEFYDDIGVHPIETGEDALYIGKDGTFVDWWNPGVISRLPFSQNDKDAFRKFRDILLAMPKPSYPLSTASSDVVKEYDAISAAEFVGRFGSDALTGTMDLYARSVLGAPLTEVNAYAFLNFYSLEFGDAYQIPCYTFAGGLGEIAARASNYLGVERVYTNSLVTNVQNDGKGVIVNYIDTEGNVPLTARAQNVIIATQKNIARHLVRDLPAAQAQAMSEIRYAPYVTIALCCDAPLFPKRAFDFWINDKDRRFTDIIDATSSIDAENGNAKRMTGNFVYMLSAPRRKSDGDSLEDIQWNVRFAQDTAEALEDHIPGAMDKIKEVHPFTWGHSMVIPSVGSHQKLSSLISQPVGNIHFANADNDLAPSVENALYWGFETARKCGG